MLTGDTGRFFASAKILAMSFLTYFTLVLPWIDANKKVVMMAANLFPLIFLSRGQTETYICFWSEELLNFLCVTKFIKNIIFLDYDNSHS